ncbi:hypothetical protein CEXT_407751 [Caerostris extrusa]|uniref:Uncharacterized protein n=1 Tax=Caerostris extrusa TaxID=172846 RepID=A0AAV4MRZ4_CAEEX|nr:hypothetical protein CEXT_407751 [Caerostris extrusa]
MNYFLLREFVVPPSTVLEHTYTYTHKKEELQNSIPVSAASFPEASPWRRPPSIIDEESIPLAPMDDLSNDAGGFTLIFLFCNAGKPYVTHSLDHRNDARIHRVWCFLCESDKLQKNSQEGIPFPVPHIPYV